MKLPFFVALFPLLLNFAIIFTRSCLKEYKEILEIYFKEKIGFIISKTGSKYAVLVSRQQKFKFSETIGMLFGL